MDCNKALTETNGDFEAAIDLLRKKGQKVAAKRAEKEKSKQYRDGQENVTPGH